MNAADSSSKVVTVWQSFQSSSWMKLPNFTLDYIVKYSLAILDATTKVSRKF